MIPAWVLNIVWFLLEKLFGVVRQQVQIIEKDKANHNSAEIQAVHNTQKASEIKPDSTGEQVSAAIDDELSHF